MKIEIEADEVIEKVVKATGNSGGVYLPPKWIGRTVKVCLIPPELDYRNFKLVSKIHDRVFYGEMELFEDTEKIQYFKSDGFRTKNIIETITPSERVDEDYVVIEDITSEFNSNLIQYIVDEVDQEFDKFELVIIR